MFTEDDLLPLSALQHLLFCERQCALIHIERLWEENRLTAEGRILHERVDEGGRESRGKVRTAFGLPLRSLRLGLSGKADTVEFHLLEGAPGATPVWRPFPVEYKRGKPKKDDSDRVQLCAQALCLEEMLGVAVPAGALFYGQTRHRVEVPFGKDLHEKTETAAARLHELIRSGVTPQARYEKKCESCSLLERCMPKVTGGGKSVARYFARMVGEERQENERSN